MKIHISSVTATVLKNKPYLISERGTIEVKGKGSMKTYYVTSKLTKTGEPIVLPYETILAEYEKQKKS
jgi:hypothetical protein